MKNYDSESPSEWKARKSKGNLPYGNKDKGRIVLAEKGRRAIFVPSFGAMEKEEVDYIIEVAQGQEDERIKRPTHSIQRERLESVTQAARNAPRGERIKTIREILKEV